MSTYVIGDVQGCFTTLQRLLERIDFDPARDRVWLVGDLVNRGPSSLEVLRWAKSLGPRLTTVLGNHDLHLLARAEGIRKPRSRDTLDAVLKAPDREALLSWLRTRPLLYREDPFVLVHAGLLPTWSFEEAEELAWEVHETLRSRNHRELLEALYREDDARRKWSSDLEGIERLRVACEALTLLRTCTEEGEMCSGFSGPPESAPEGCRPWFELATFPDSLTFLFGHWARLGLYAGRNYIGLDTGCVWGGSLTALRLEDREVFQEPSELETSR